MKNHAIALMVYGEPGSARNALTEEKYRKLAAHFIEKGFDVVDGDWYKLSRAAKPEGSQKND